MFFDNSSPTAPVAAVRPSQQTSPGSSRPLAFKSEADEEAFLSDLDMALESPRTHVLLGYDALTPHVHDVVDFR